jgi:hypothetical protein
MSEIAMFQQLKQMLSAGSRFAYRLLSEELCGSWGWLFSCLRPPSGKSQVESRKRQSSPRAARVLNGYLYLSCVQCGTATKL